MSRADCPASLSPRRLINQIDHRARARVPRGGSTSLPLLSSGGRAHGEGRVLGFILLIFFSPVGFCGSQNIPPLVYTIEIIWARALQRRSLHNLYKIHTHGMYCICTRLLPQLACWGAGDVGSFRFFFTSLHGMGDWGMAWHGTAWRRGIWGQGICGAGDGAWMDGMRWDGKRGVSPFFCFGREDGSGLFNAGLDEMG